MKPFHSLKSQHQTILYSRTAKKRRSKKKHSKFLKKTKRYRSKREWQSHIQSIQFERKKIQKEIFGKYDFTAEAYEFSITGAAGIETQESLKNFIMLGFEAIESNSSDLRINIKKTSRLWPSAVLQICTLDNWKKLAVKTEKNSAKETRLRISKSKNENVTDYLYHCGFMKYVKNTDFPNRNNHFNNNVVKIEKISDRSVIDKITTNISELIKKESALNETEIEKFNCIILTEIMNNIIEHGITYGNEQGWWILVQKHPKHGFISLNFADNGIGFKNSILTGPQKNSFNKADSESDFIEKALQEEISGAVDALTKDGSLIKKYPKGARRGHGLKKVKTTAQELSIPIAIFSHYGYILIDRMGNFVEKKSLEKRIFAGTMYNLVIPAR